MTIDPDGPTRPPAETGDDGRFRVRLWCNVIAAIVFAGAGAYLLLGADKGNGILGLLLAAMIARVLVLNVAERFD
ncbi:MAG: hypothetical protein KDA25_04285 [Phycisphaerales bacterium]|nr:hypothetical protein [Phycisphaerales bacterium]